MTNEVLQALLSRRSCRAYADRTVERELLDEVLRVFSLNGLEPIRFIAANRGVCFGKNSCNIRILLQIFASHPLTICPL